jgi:hypothetical protein
MFNTNEREWLRLALRSQVDWAALRQIARTGLHYGPLRQLSLLHQADGVIAWRLAAPELDGVVPPVVRDACQGYLDYLNGGGFRERWADSARVIAEGLRDRGLAHYYSGSPSYYSAWGMDPGQWPRATTGGCFTALAGDAHEFADILAPLGQVEVLDWCATAVRSDGQRLWINVAPVAPTDPGDVTVPASWFERVKATAVYGVELPLLPAEAALILRGSDIAYDVGNLCPLSLGSLAHIAALTGQVRSWELVDSLLEQQQAEGRDGLTPALHHIVWAWGLAQQAFGTFDTSWLDSGCFDLSWLEGWKRAAGYSLPVRRASALTDFHAAGELVQIYVANLERLLFDLRGREGVAERMEDGVFELVR